MFAGLFAYPLGRHDVQTGIDLVVLVLFVYVDVFVFVSVCVCY